jgi:hypothetical protein
VGRFIKDLVIIAVRKPGEHNEFLCFATDLKPGVYFIGFQANGKSQFIKMVKQ